MADYLTPVEKVDGIFIKREDKFQVAEVCGGKARTCWFLSQGARGLVTAGSRQSPQANIVAHIAKELKIPCRIHTPTGQLSPELIDAREYGAEIIQHKAGYNNVIIARAREDAINRGWINIPFGMECQEAVEQTRKQVKNISSEIKRIVVTVGSGMSLSGILWGLIDNNLQIPVLGIVVGANPTKRLNRYAPLFWRRMVTLANCGIDYHTNVKGRIGDINLDSVYEAKCLPYINTGDLFWIIGLRKTQK